MAFGLQARYLRKRILREEKEMESCGKIAMEAIENIRTVQALTLQQKIHNKFCKHLEVPIRTGREKAIVLVWCQFERGNNPSECGIRYYSGDPLYIILYLLPSRTFPHLSRVPRTSSHVEVHVYGDFNLYRSWCYHRIFS